VARVEITKKGDKKKPAKMAALLATELLECKYQPKRGTKTPSGSPVNPT
jgi:hypothetical protein